MASLPVEIVLGIYLGLLTGIIPAVVAFGLGFLFKYFTGVTIPALGVVVLALAIAGANGGLLALTDPTVSQAPNSGTLITAIIVVMMMSLYSHSQGDKLGVGLPRRLSLRAIRNQRLSADVVDLVGGRGQVEVGVAGVVEDVEGYPPLSSGIREEIADRTWTFPADLPLDELETRVSDALRTEFDLAEVSVHLDERARARVAAAPARSGVSKRVPAGRRAVSIDALVPTGLARGDEVAVRIGGETVVGTVVSARSDRPDGPSYAGAALTDGGEDGGTGPATVPAVTSADGGDGRVTLAVAREDVPRLLGVDRGHVVVKARGRRREFELLSLLRRTGRRVRRLSIGPDSELVGSTIGEAAVRDRYGVVVLALRGDGGWTIAPRGGARIEAGDEVFVVGKRDDLTAFAGVAG